ncbi:hypothetical protein D3C71_1978230 [compost metagenome]
MAGRPSGTEATARLISATSSSPSGISRIVKANTKSNTIITRIRMKMFLPRRSICCSNGVRWVLTVEIISLMWPSSV